MSKRDEMNAKYAADLKEKLSHEADMDLLTKVTIGCGPSIYNKDSSTVSAGSESELETVKNNFLIKKLGLEDSPKLMEGLHKVMDDYGGDRYKYEFGEEQHDEQNKPTYIYSYNKMFPWYSALSYSIYPYPVLGLLG